MPPARGKDNTILVATTSTGRNLLFARDLTCIDDTRFDDANGDDVDPADPTARTTASLRCAHARRA
jgi:hypothetical protein